MMLPRFRIGVLMGVIALAALDFGVVRAVIDFESPYREGIDLAAGALPMANALAAGILFRGRRGIGPFLLGFEAFGAAALAVYIALRVFFYEVLLKPYVRGVLNPILGAMLQLPDPTLTSVQIFTLNFIGAAMVNLPQLAFALLGGFLFRRFRRRRTAGQR